MKSKHAVMARYPGSPSDLVLTVRKRMSQQERAKNRKRMTRLIEPRHEKPVFAICEQQRRRSACASAQSFVVRC